jgi:hypothetical protein
VAMIMIRANKTSVAPARCASAKRGGRGVLAVTHSAIWADNFVG